MDIKASRFSHRLLWLLALILLALILAACGAPAATPKPARTYGACTNRTID